MNRGELFLYSLATTLSTVLVLIFKPYEISVFDRVKGFLFGNSYFMDLYIDFTFIIIAFLSLIVCLYAGISCLADEKVECEKEK
jgi:hypothetical protein